MSNYEKLYCICDSLNRDLHCHLVGYYNNKQPTAPSPSGLVCQMPQLGTSSSLDLVETNLFTPTNLERTTLVTASTQPLSCLPPTELKCDGSIQTGWLTISFSVS